MTCPACAAIPKPEWFIIEETHCVYTVAEVIPWEPDASRRVGECLKELVNENPNAKYYMAFVEDWREPDRG